jgi:polysaccharide deacetylase family protein (PEP-CTERM system associated)
VNGSGIVNAMTIDVEEHFHASVFNGIVHRRDWDDIESRVCANTDRLLELLADAGVSGTFFVLGCVAKRHPHQVRRIVAGGHEVASHGYWHELIYEQTQAAFREDVRRAKDVLESLSGTRVHGYRAPSYSVTARSLWALDVLAEEGYSYDASIFPIHHDRYGIPAAPRHPYVAETPGGPITEAPPSTVRVGSLNLPIAGGGYFRLLPYAWTRWGMRRLNRVEQRPAIFYTHPWEIDPEQPRIPLGRVSAYRHYHNLDKTEGRLRRLLSDFRFAPLRTLLPTPETLGAPVRLAC